MQFEVAMCCLGSNGNGAAVFRLKNLFHVGYGTINLYTTWVTKVIYQMRSRLASWPTTKEQLESSQFMQEEGFPACVGFVDGTTIQLSQKPPIDGNHYFDCKKRCSQLCLSPLHRQTTDAFIFFSTDTPFHSL